MALVIKGKITTFAQGQRIAAWGGKECWLSSVDRRFYLCVKRPKKPRMLPLNESSPDPNERFRLYANYVKDGKLTIEVKYLKVRAQVQIQTEEDIPQLQELATLLQDLQKKQNVGHWHDTIGEVQFVPKGKNRGYRRKGTEGVFKELYQLNNDHNDNQQNKEGPANVSLTYGGADAKFFKYEAKLSKEQKKIARQIRDKRNVFFTGCAGTGKTYLIKAIRKMFDSQTTFITASTGVAAVEVGGFTLHSFAGIGLGKATADQLYSLVLRNPKAVQNWTKCKLLVIDEISMIDAELFDKLDEVARKVKKVHHRPFGGIQLVLSGDFLQLPPVNKSAGAKYVFESKAWGELQMEMLPLTQVFRQTDKEFVDLLDAVRHGETDERMIAQLRSRVNASLDVEEGIIPTKLMAVNENVDAENYTNLADLTGKMKTFHAADRGAEPLLKNLDAGGLPKRLDLKIGAQVMLLKNMPQVQLMNGSRGVVTGYSASGDPVVKFMNGLVQPIERDTYDIEVNGQVQATRRQYPLKLAWATTIHKSQGCELDCAELTLDSSIFESGQAYTALSRIKSLSGLRLKKFDPKCIKANPRVLQFLEENHLARKTQLVDEDAEDAASSEGEGGNVDDEEASCVGGGDDDDDGFIQDDYDPEDPKEATKKYCICNQPASADEFMIECENCHKWYHGQCVAVSKDYAKTIDQWICDDCENLVGRVITYKRGVELHCHCNRPAALDDYMIQCDECAVWFHLCCVEIEPEAKDKINSYVCDHCTEETGKETTYHKTAEEEMEEVEAAPVKVAEAEDPDVGGLLFEEDEPNTTRGPPPPQTPTLTMTVDPVGLLHKEDSSQSPNKKRSRSQEDSVPPDTSAKRTKASATPEPEPLD
eukprot:TRINITY_DN49142_c0_g1_i1.p1 TRINITY_DN49142_c0_g1~~TRINITY_DN49142_c0_g1_i1.p1  ORF type:complete len:874 (+),score=120.55 TRINITY_DN49142_c0_g1_i1:48-2669(+)